MKVLITGVKSYDFTNGDGQKIEGAKISYLGNKPSVKQGETGFTPMQITCNKEILLGIEALPGIYEADFEMVPGRNNKPEMAITGFTFLYEVDIAALFNSVKQKTA